MFDTQELYCSHKLTKKKLSSVIVIQIYQFAIYIYLTENISNLKLDLATSVTIFAISFKWSEMKDLREARTLKVKVQVFNC